MIKFSKASNEQSSESGNIEKIPEYRTIEKIVISKNLLASLVKFCENPTKNEVEGILFGHEEEHEIIVETALPLPQNSQHLNEDSMNLVIKLKIILIYLLINFLEKLFRKQQTRFHSNRIFLLQSIH